jgi:hypothetical protein
VSSFRAVQGSGEQMHIPYTAACSAGLPQAPVSCSVLHYLLSETLGFDFSRPTRSAIHCPGFDAVPKQSLCHLINARTGRESKLKVSKLPTCERDLGSVLRKSAADKRFRVWVPPRDGVRQGPGLDRVAGAIVTGTALTVELGLETFRFRYAGQMHMH